MAVATPLRQTLVPPQLAAHYAGRPVGTLYRWASEGRITRHGTGRTTQYDLAELPLATRDDWTGTVITPGAPPPLPHHRP